MDIGQIAELQSSLELWDEAAEAKQAFANRYTNDEGEVTCGYEAWDEAMADYNEQLAERGEHLADEIRKALG